MSDERIRRPVATVNGAVTITTAAYLTIVAKAANLKSCSALEVFNASGSILKLALGDVGSEVDLPYTILPGGSTGLIVVEIPAGVRISAKAIDADTAAAQFVLNRFG